MYRFSRYLESIRKSRGIDDATMAGILCVTREQLLRIESGRQPPPPETLIAYSNAVGLPVEELMIHHLNEYATNFCKMVGVGGKLEFTWKETECGMLEEMEARSRFIRNQGRQLRPLARTTTPGSTTDLAPLG